MGLMSIVRNKAFWLLDGLKNGQVKNAYKTISDIDRRDSGDLYIADYQDEAWKLLRSHAVNETSFYKNYRENDSLREFPIISKNDIKSQQDAFLSNKYNKEDLVQMSTSGSTGTPFVSYQNSNKKSGLMLK